MVKTSQLTKSHYRPKDIAEFLGVTIVVQLSRQKSKHFIMN